MSLPLQKSLFLKYELIIVKGMHGEMDSVIECCVLIISHSNYMIKSGGVEKFIREYCGILKKNGMHYIHAFPVIEINRRLNNTFRNRLKTEYVCISFDGKFQGILNINRLAEAINCLLNNNKCILIEAQIHHFHGWSIKQLKTVLEKMNVPITIFAHDLEMFCQSMFLPGANEQCKMKVSVAGDEICEGCPYRDEDVTKYKDIEYFFRDLLNLINTVYVPSKNTMKHFTHAFPILGDRVHLRSHLTYSLEHITRTLNKPIRIAYLGSIELHKGYAEWNIILDSIAETNRYNFYYFGSANIDDKRVKSILVDARDTQLKSMAQQLIENDIDIVVLWSKCQETFCYTYYEAFEGGSFVITNEISGNICDQVNKNKNGKVFRNITDCVNFLYDIENVTVALRQFMKNNLVLTDVRPNEDISGIYRNKEIISNRFSESLKCNSKIQSFRKISINRPLTFLYKKMRLENYESKVKKN